MLRSTLERRVYRSEPFIQMPFQIINSSLHRALSQPAFTKEADYVCSYCDDDGDDYRNHRPILSSRARKYYLPFRIASAFSMNACTSSLNGFGMVAGQFCLSAYILFKPF